MCSFAVDSAAEESHDVPHIRVIDLIERKGLAIGQGEDGENEAYLHRNEVKPSCGKKETSVGGDGRESCE